MVLMLKITPFYVVCIIHKINYYLVVVLGGVFWGVGYFFGGGGVSSLSFYFLCKVFLSSTSYSRVQLHACADSLKRNRI